MHSSFGVHRHHSEEIGSQSFSTAAPACRPRRSISSSSGQAHTRHIICPLATQPTEENMNVTQEDQNKDSFDDDEEEENNHHDELNLAVVDGNEDGQSLRAEHPEGLQQENGSLDVAFIDEADLERLAKQSEQSHSPMNTTEPLDSNADAHQTSAMMVSVLMEKSLNKDDELDDILRRNANRAIRLTDSDVGRSFPLFTSPSKVFSLSGRRERKSAEQNFGFSAEHAETSRSTLFVDQQFTRLGLAIGSSVEQIAREGTFTLRVVIAHVARHSALWIRT